MDKKLPITFMKQPMMRKVILSLSPIIMATIYFYGWRSIILLSVCCIAGCFAEWLFKRATKKPVTEAVFVSALLYGLTLPPSTPYWMAAIGIIFGIIFGKEVFGGFGRNVFNPALVGRAFVYVCFPIQMTNEWNVNMSGGLGGFLTYLSPAADAVTGATPMIANRISGETTSLIQLFFGTTAGSLGETSAFLILLGAAYLLYTKTADWKLMASTLTGFLAMTLFLILIGSTHVLSPLQGLLSGGLLFGAVFMATDPISAPKTTEAKIVYGLLIGIITVVIRTFSLFTGGMMFAILIANTFGPLLDEIAKSWQAYAKSKQKAAGGESNA